MTTELIYYKPRGVAAHNDGTRPGIDTLSYFFQIYTAGAIPVDRTGTIKNPISVRPLFPMVKFVPMKRSFEELCNERAQELLSRAERLNVPLCVSWSGGIDSTLVLISLLKNATQSQKDNLVVLLSSYSIAENPRFFDEHIRGKLKTETSSMVPNLIGSKAVFTNGEHNDQLFGADVVGMLITRFGSKMLYEPYNRDLYLEYYLDSIDNPAAANKILDIIEKSIPACPISITTNYDFTWWVNFNFKWQTVYSRILLYIDPHRATSMNSSYARDYYAPFYNTEYFQLWSLNNPEKKIKDEWRTYKWVCKDIIYDFTGDAEYRDNKIKSASLGNLVKVYDAFTFLDSNYTLTPNMDPEEFYVPQNDFIL